MVRAISQFRCREMPPARGIVAVPGGSLDTDPGLRAQARIFAADKSPWFDVTRLVPQFAGMPPA